MRKFVMYPHQCSRCGKTFEASGKPVPGTTMYCRDCFGLVRRINLLQKKLIEQDFSLEQEDDHIARQINELLIRESSGISDKDEELLTALTERIIKDEGRRKRILTQLGKLQKKKG